MARTDFDRVVFRKSSYSDGGNGCVEAGTLDSRRLVRDSKDPEGDVLTLRQDAWATMIAEIKRGAYDV